MERESAIGGAVARAFAAEGAFVYLAGRTEPRLQKVAQRILEDGGLAETAVVDALNEEQVEEFVAHVAKKSRRIDISFNVISFGDIQQPLMEIDVDDFTQPVTLATRTHFLTTRAAATHDQAALRRRADVRRLRSADAAGAGRLQGRPRRHGGAAAAMGDRAGNLWHPRGHHGDGGIIETIPWQAEGREEILAEIARAAHLNRTATLADVGNVACFIASDKAGAITDATVNISAGAIVDY